MKQKNGNSYKVKKHINKRVKKINKCVNFAEKKRTRILSLHKYFITHLLSYREEKNGEKKKHQKKNPLRILVGKIEEKKWPDTFGFLHKKNPKNICSNLFFMGGGGILVEFRNENCTDKKMQAHFFCTKKKGFFKQVLKMVFFTLF